MTEQNEKQQRQNVCVIVTEMETCRDLKRRDVRNYIYIDMRDRVKTCHVQWSILHFNDSFLNHIRADKEKRKKEKSEKGGGRRWRYCFNSYRRKTFSLCSIGRKEQSYIYLCIWLISPSNSAAASYPILYGLTVSIVQGEVWN